MKSLTYSSILIEPLSTSRKSTAAVNRIDREAMWNRVFAVLGTCCSRFAKAIAFLKNNPAIALDHNTSCKISALNVSAKIRVDRVRGGGL
jgi:hypothetical protein